MSRKVDRTWTKRTKLSSRIVMLGAFMIFVANFAEMLLVFAEVGEHHFHWQTFAIFMISLLSILDNTIIIDFVNEQEERYDYADAELEKNASDN